MASSLTHSLTKRHFWKSLPQSTLRDLWPLRHVIRVMRRHDLTKKFPYFFHWFQQKIKISFWYRIAACLLKMKVHLIQAQTFERVVPNWKKSPMCKFFFCMISIKMLWNDSEFFDVTLAWWGDKAGGVLADLNPLNINSSRIFISFVCLFGSNFVVY